MSNQSIAIAVLALAAGIGLMTSMTRKRGLKSIQAVGWVINCLVVLTTIGMSSGVIGRDVHESPISTLQTASVKPTPPTDVEDKRDLSKFGLVNYEHSQIPTVEREIRNKRYDGQEWVYKVMNNPEAAGVGRIQDVPEMPLFPLPKGTLVVIGEVIQADAYLSNDKEGVYTEFRINVKEVLSNLRGKNQKVVVADRAGGVVVYPNGQRVTYLDRQSFLPELGSTYLFFLTRPDQSPKYSILGSFDITKDSVRPMETFLRSDEIRWKDRSEFLTKIRKRVGDGNQK